MKSLQERESGISINAEILLENIKEAPAHIQIDKLFLQNHTDHTVDELINRKLAKWEDGELELI